MPQPVGPSEDDPESRNVPRPDPRPDLRADCGRCAGLCCVEPAFVASADFAISKPARTPCPNLLDDLRCGIHEELPERGFPGCAAFDCFGAGQRLTQAAFVAPGREDDPARAASTFDAFPVLRQLCEHLWHLTEAETASLPPTLADEVARERRETERLAGLDVRQLTSVDTEGERHRIGDLLGRVSEAIRADVMPRPADRRGADLIGADLRRTPLRGASLRGALLLGADLRGAELTRTDLLGADLRGANLRGAALAGALFLTQPQIDAALGDDATTLPNRLQRPRRWSTPARSRRGARSRPARPDVR